MKKKLAILLLVLTCLVSAGWSGRDRTEKTETEPDTGSRTLTRTIGRRQTVVYRFHAVQTAADASLCFAVFDKDVEDFRRSDNWCTVNVGFESGKKDSAFGSGHTAGLPEKECWTPASRSDTWTMRKPYGKMEDVKEADLELTITRAGRMLRATLAVDGVKVWRAQETVKNLDSMTVCLYVYADHYSLTNVEFRDQGATGWIIPGWARPLLAAALLAVAFGVLMLGNLLETHTIGTDMSLYAVGFVVCAAALALLIAGRSHPNILGAVTFGYSPFPMPSGGPGFWVPAVMFGVLGVVIFAYPICKKKVNPPDYVLCAPLAGLLHMPFLYVVVSEFFNLLKMALWIVLVAVCLMVLRPVFLILLGVIEHAVDKIKGMKDPRDANNAGAPVDAEAGTVPDKDPKEK